jgi:hypothetical protein
MSINRLIHANSCKIMQFPATDRLKNKGAAVAPSFIRSGFNIENWMLNDQRFIQRGSSTSN